MIVRIHKFEDLESEIQINLKWVLKIKGMQIKFSVTHNNKPLVSLTSSNRQPNNGFCKIFFFYFDARFNSSLFQSIKNTLTITDADQSRCGFHISQILLIIIRFPNWSGRTKTDAQLSWNNNARDITTGRNTNQTCLCNIA